jgi:hypothetical protein
MTGTIESHGWDPQQNSTFLARCLCDVATKKTYKESNAITLTSRLLRRRLLREATQSAEEMKVPI